MSFGDYQYNGAMQLFSQLPPEERTFKNPRELATSISHSLQSSDIFEKVEVAGPGFINFFLSDEYISREATRLLKNANSAWPLRSEKVIVDFSSPNIAKEMHVGHLRSTIIGDSLCRALEYRGFDVSRVNHVGDWGTQFGMLISYMREHGKEGVDDLSDLQSFYKKAKVKFDADEDFKQRSQSAVTQLQAYEDSTLKTWQQICQVSRAEFEELYKELDVEIQERGESFYNSIIPSVLDELIQEGIAVVNDGALCVFSGDSAVPLICRKSDGGFNYASTDLAALYHRTQVEDADWIIYVTDMSQRRHFESVFDTARRVGWLSRKKSVAVDHVGFGLVIGEDGKRLRTRSGDTIKLKDLLAEAKERCLEQFQARKVPLELHELQAAAHDLGVSAVKYADLRNNLSTNYTFSFDRMLDLKGNTAVYLQYTFARVHSILERSKNERTEDSLIRPGHPACSTSQERALLLHLLKFEDTVDCMLNELMPSKVCEFTYNLCVLFNNFYTECKVFGVSEENARLATCTLTSDILQKCFKIIGMKPLRKI
ncbi:tRNA synthetases class I (R)-domain-containing protein [Ostreococcus tauri]|uniref:arginine--tRNA ligase n=1 Tax=Ostreococcus tauri TaxID=70448 RepID=A0A1Y5HXV8_OSTTA|nr:tRNA synthetases class I (R)-domain-containing protein [Ostreococcus tauri]